VVIRSYRHRMGNAPGDPHYAPLEARLASLPTIRVPTIVIHGAADDVNPHQNSQGHQRYFTAHYERRLVDNVGHNPPQEAPQAFAQAILDLCNHQ
jgi:pimeloyl-ACP methyl ester carboxylesterase